MSSRCAGLQINSQSPAINFCFRHFTARAKSTYVNGEKTDRLLENECACLSLERLMEVLACGYYICLRSFPPSSSRLFLQLTFGEVLN